MEEGDNEQVLLVDKNGRVVPMLKGLVPYAREGGYLPATPEQVEQHEIEKKYSGGLEQAKAAAEGFAQALTLGASTHAETGLGISTPEAIKAREEYAGTGHGIGTALGVAIPVLATGGAAAPEELAAQGLIRGGARAASEFTAPALISRLGATVSGGVKAGIEGALPEATGLLGKLATKAASVAAGSSAEAGAYELGQLVHEDALGDPNTIAQKAASRLGEAMLYGGVIGGGLGAVEGGLPSLILKSRDAIADFGKQAGEAVKSGYASKLGEAATGTEGKVSDVLFSRKQEAANLDALVPGTLERLNSADADMAKWALDNAGEYREFAQKFPKQAQAILGTSPETADKLVTSGAWRQVFTDPEARIKFSTEMANSMQDVLDATTSLSKRLHGEIAPKEVEELLAGASPELSQAAYTKAYDAMDKAATMLRAERDSYIPAYAKEVENLRDAMVERAEESANPVDAFNRLKDLRRHIGDAKSKFPAGKLALDQQNTRDALGDLYREVGSILKDPEYFGEAAARRVALDEATHDWIQATGKDSLFRKYFLERGKAIEGKELRVVPRKLNVWLNQMGDLRGEQQFSEPWGNVMKVAKKLAATAEDSNKTALVSDFDHSALESLVDKSGEITQKTQAAAGPTRMMNQLDPRMSWGSNPVIPETGDVIKEILTKHLEKGLGESIPGLGSVIGFAKKAASVPSAVRTLAALERIGKQSSDAIDRGAAMLVRGGERSSHILRSEVAAGVSSSFGKDQESQEKLYAKRSKETRRLASDPMALQDRLETATQGWSQHAPKVSQALMVNLAGKTAFLNSKLPTPPQAPLASKWKPSRSEVATYNRIHEVVHNPNLLMKQAAAGTLTSDAVNAVRQTSPQYFQEYQNAIMSRISTHPDSIPYAQRTMISALLGQDMDGTLTPSMIMRNQQAINGPSAKSGEDQKQVRPTSKGAKAITLSSRFETPMQAANSRK